MPKKILKIAFIAIFVFLSVKSFSQIDQEQIYKFNQVIENINNFYVDSIDVTKLVKSAIVATLKELDPHSVYFDKEELEELNRGLVGSFVGVGITYDIIKDTVLVLSVTPDGPSEKAGLLPGDRIIKVGKEEIANNEIDDSKLKDLLAGEEGTKVTVFVKRTGQRRLKEIEIQRNKIPVKSIDAAYNISNEITYIKLKRFSATSVSEFNEVTEKLLIPGSNKIILDLRNNSGGYLYVSVKLLEKFLKKNSVVLYTKGENSPEKEYKTHLNGKFKHANLVVLINESSASAAEIVSGAIQDWDRGVVVGRRSFGKGLVQKPIYLVDGSMIRLTIAKYFTPSGRNIQKPYDKGIENYNHEIIDRLDKGELMNKDSVKYKNSSIYHTLNNKRIIYGGGGIMPDIFVELDTSEFPQFYKEFIKSGKVNEFVHLFVDKNRNFFNKSYSKFKDFSAKYNVYMKNIEELITYLYEGEEDNVLDYVDEIYTNDLAMTHIKALIAYDLYGRNEYFKIYNQKDKIVLKAVEILNDDKKYSEILNSNIIGEYVEK
ncbi:MAG: S41 family peptidase [Bacteroidales bacterium]|nr:S41 family peptidase [Bacteroidales bacterium]